MGSLRLGKKEKPWRRGELTEGLSDGADKVLLAIRGADLSKMSTYLSRRVEAQKNIEILFHTQIRKTSGGKMLEEAELENTKTGERRVIRTPAIFSMIGANPCTEWLPGEIERDEKGFIKTGSDVADSPAWKLGFQVIPFKQIGPQPDAERQVLDKLR